MLKNILSLEGAQQLSKNEQKSIKGGLAIDFSKYSSCQYYLFNISQSQCMNLPVYQKPLWNGSTCSATGTGSCNGDNM
ncbi:hypothetical protein [Flavobacterium terrigena]|uniref:Uncharacterized protein n=1 Tax=Flavobacterium terrigena TaxID=402734 RepID=A0A1H6VKH4_9FLAO|nr:hypothetical protein [Flavobacterium terrigena]SEJ03484.1 hypothetical protein SAMN05660918_2223 [Flavobacterium terrigena]